MLFVEKSVSISEPGMVVIQEALHALSLQLSTSMNKSSTGTELNWMALPAIVFIPPE